MSEVVDLNQIATNATHRIAWSQQSEDLNVNLLILRAGEQVEPHVNNEVDVLIVGVRGQGAITIDGHEHDVTAGDAVVIPRGAERAIANPGSEFTYLTCHRKRRGLWPTPAEDKERGEQ